MAMAIALPAKLNFLPIMLPSASRSRSSHSLKLKPASCAAPLQEEVVDVGIMCEPCNGKGWLVCDYCEGQKINVKAPNNRIYRRCPSCRAVGYVLCSKCKVFKCVTFPNYNDGSEKIFSSREVDASLVTCGSWSEKSMDCMCTD